jgi:hypothetical protein
MMRARPYLLLPLCLSACERGRPGSTTTPDGANAQTSAVEDQSALASGASLEIVAVPQRVPDPDPSMWNFDPSGRLMAQDFFEDDGTSGCGIWDIESGTFVRAHLYTDDEAEDPNDPCIVWDADPRMPSETSADGKLIAWVDGGLEIEVVDGPTRSVRGCASCEGAMAWAPSGHQLATSNGTMLEIWDADTGKRVRSETLGLGDIYETVMGWTEEGIGVAVVHQISGTCDELNAEGYCDAYEEDEEGGEELLDGYALSSFWLPADGGKPIARIERHKGTEIPDFYADVGVRWLAFVSYMSYERDDTATTTVDVLGVGPRSSALGWTATDGEGLAIERWNGRWRVDTATQWIEGLTVTESEDMYYGTMTADWHAVVTEPNPAIHHGELGEISGGGPTGDVEVLAASGGAAVAAWELCVEDGDEQCKSGGPPSRDCELLDVSPSLALSLVACDSGLQLIEASGSRGRPVFVLPHDPSSAWHWGRGNYLALLGPGQLDVIDLATSKSLYQRTDVVEVLVAPLAAEQDRLALLYVDHLELVAGSTGQRLIDVPGEWIAAALSPDGKHIAVLGDTQVRVTEIANGTTIATIPITPDAFYVAWRQDGAALFYGHDFPTHAVDPKTGALLYELDQAKFDIMEIEDIDPSWRWLRGSDGSIVRTLDFRRIELGNTWVRLESGMFEGELADLPVNLRFRVGDKPDAPAIYTVAELEPWLRSPGLMEAFFTGQPLPSPRVPADALAKLDAKKSKG